MPKLLESYGIGGEVSWHSWRVQYGCGDFLVGQGMKDVGNKGGRCAKVVEANSSSMLEFGPCLTIVAKASIW